MLDDFGTGFSSLSYLRSFPFDRIKIDRSFMKDFGLRTDADAIVRAIVGLGRSLRIPVTAEGVETFEQFELVRAEGCDEAQGHLISRPIQAADVLHLMSLLAAGLWPTGGPRGRKTTVRPGRGGKRSPERAARVRHTPYRIIAGKKPGQTGSRGQIRPRFAEISSISS